MQAERNARPSWKTPAGVGLLGDVRGLRPTESAGLKATYTGGDILVLRIGGLAARIWIGCLQLELVGGLLASFMVVAVVRSAANELNRGFSGGSTMSHASLLDRLES